MELILHIGAHRTGTTAMQDMLVANAAILAGAGVTALVHAELNARVPGFTRVPRREDWAPARAAFEAATATAGTVLVSDENMIGDMGWNVRSASFYWRAKTRLEAFRDFLPVVPARIGLGVRSYESYWISAHALDLSYRDATRDGLRRFADVRADLAALARGWRAVVDDVRAVFPECEILVWPIEADRPVETLANRLLDAMLDFTPPPPRVNAAPEPGLIPAMEDMRSARPGIGRIEMRDWLASQAPRPFEGFGAAQSAFMAARYDADIAAFADGYADVTLVARPEARAA